MRIFGNRKNANQSAKSRMEAAVTSLARTPTRASAAVAVAPVLAPEPFAIVDLSRTEETPVVRDESALSPAVPALRRPSYPALTVTPLMPLTPGPDSASADDVGEDGDSDVFVCRASRIDLEASPEAAAAEAVTLFVYGWDNVEPGPLSWAFPSLRSALDAVKTMRNAIEWSIVAGSEWVSIEAARESGAVLIEQNA